MTLVCTAPHSLALDGTVVRVSDGDSFWLRTAPGRRPQRIRLQGIDAPELCQPGGREARQALETLVLGRRIVIRQRAVDRYGRRLVQALHGDQDVAEALVQQGWAWSEEYRGKPGTYAARERQARAKSLGVFAHPDATPPWVFRQQHGPCVGLPISPALPAEPAPHPAKSR